MEEGMTLEQAVSALKGIPSALSVERGVLPLSKDKISKKTSRKGHEVRVFVDDATYELLVKYSDDVAMSIPMFAKTLLRQAVKRWQPDLEAGPRRWGKAAKSKTLRETQFHPSGWPRDVGCPWSACTRSEPHDPAEHPVMAGPMIAAALRSLYSDSGIVVKGGVTVRRTSPT